MDYKINPKECEYIPDEKFPLLVLASKEKHDFKDEKFIAIAHQTAGHGCHQHYMFGKILRPKKKTKVAMEGIQNYWLNTDCGAFGVNLDEIITYKNQLNKLLGVNCNNSYYDFEEGIYPIDCSVKNLKKLCTDKFPENLDELINFESNSMRLCGAINRWKIYILGENCD